MIDSDSFGLRALNAFLWRRNDRSAIRRKIITRTIADAIMMADHTRKVLSRSNELLLMVILYSRKQKSRDESRAVCLVLGVGVEPTKAEAGRFTV